MFAKKRIGAIAFCNNKTIDSSGCIAHLDMQAKSEQYGTWPVLGTSRGTPAVILGAVGEQLGLPGWLPRFSSLVSSLSLSLSPPLSLSLSFPLSLSLSIYIINYIIYSLSVSSLFFPRRLLLLLENEAYERTSFETPEQQTANPGAGPPGFAKR